MKKLIIAEKSTVALTLAANGQSVLGEFYLGGKKVDKSNIKALDPLIKRQGYIDNKDYIITYTQGHLVELFQAYDYNPAYKNWRSIPDNFIPNPFKTKVKSGKDAMYKTIEKLLNSPDVSEIINACDADREGDNIFSIVYDQAKCKKPVKRLWTDEHTEKDVVKALNTLKDASHYKSLTDAGYCRMTSDWILGALLTAKTTVELSGGKEILNVGRVQTAVLSEIVRIEELNKNFKSKKYYQVIADFTTSDGRKYSGVYEEEFDDIAKAEAFAKALKSKKGIVKSYESVNKRSYSPPLFDQTSLAIHMAGLTGMDPDKTLEATQSLYESGYTTYPRTSSNYITKSKADDFADMYGMISSVNPLAKKHGFNKNDKRIVDDSKVNSHPAIIPTTDIPNLSKLTQNERDVYLEVVKRVIAVNFPPAVDAAQTAITEVDGFDFKTTGKKEVERGFREVYDAKVNDTSIPELKTSEPVTVVSSDKKEVVTQPPKRYTAATILKFMETCGKKIEDEEMRQIMKDKGIGTSATRANILKGLQDHGYILTKGKAKTLYPTEKGEKLIGILPVDELKNAEFTGEIEYKLSKVEKGEIEPSEYMASINELYHLSVKKIKGTQNKIISASPDEVGKCPLCGNSVTKKKGKNGVFYGCTNWKNGCKFSVGELYGKKLTDTQMKTLLEKGSTARISGFKKKDGSPMVSAKVVLDTKTGKTSLDFS